MTPATLHIALGVFALLLLVVALLPLLVPNLLQPRSKTQGQFVAEVWLEWEICRGSTMYRQRFRTRWGAAVFAKLYAVILDGVLPTHYMDTDYLGRPKAYRHEYAIHFGVRTLAASEHEHFDAFYSNRLPGHSHYQGEHASAHPWNRDEALKLGGSLYGFRL